MQRYIRKSAVFAGLLLGPIIGSAQQTGDRAAPTENLDAIVQGIRANVVEGRVVDTRSQETLKLQAGFELKEDDLIETGSDGRAEVLLQPGYVLRVGAATTGKLVATEPDRFKLRLDQGSISFEVLKDDLLFRGSSSGVLEESYQQIRVVTRGTEIVISRAGIYRINASVDGRTELIVRDGEAVINGQRVKQKRLARAARATIETREFDPKIEDTFDVWCRARARALVVANRLLRDAPWSLARKSGKEAVLDLPPVEPQDDTAFIMSAKLATVNFVEPGVEARQGRQDWQELTAETDLVAGDGVRTGEHSRTELLLLPNVYLRLDENSELVFEKLSYDELEAKLIRGHAILDVVKFDSKRGAPITWEGTSSSFTVVKEGNYRLNVGKSNDEIIVRKGKATIGGNAVGGCRKVVGGVQSSCDHQVKDSFDIWSQERGEGPAFDGRPKEAYLARVKRTRMRYTGFWYLHPTAGYYTFVPFFSVGFRSPYGGRYSNVFSEDKGTFLRRQGLNRIGQAR